MALGGAKFNSGGSAGQTAVTLASLIGNRRQYKMLEFTVPSGNSGVFTISTTATVGAGTFKAFVNGVLHVWQINPGATGTTPAGESFTIDPSSIYLLGGAAADVCYIAYLT